jgi:hypothetical protein
MSNFPGTSIWCCTGTGIFLAMTVIMPVREWDEIESSVSLNCRVSIKTERREYNITASYCYIVKVLVRYTMSAATTDYPARSHPRTLALFDVDGTLTIPRGEVTEDMLNFMKELSANIVVGIVGGTLTISALS